MKTAVIFLLLLGLTVSCEDEPINQGRPCKYFLLEFDPLFGIDYDNPDTYKLQGSQSQLDASYFEAVHASLGDLEATVEDLFRITQWVGYNFTFVNRGGREIGKPTVNQLFNSMEFYGCHSQALLIASIAREYGIPALLVETASIDWAENYKEDENIPFVGHVMTEAYVDGNWVLFDNNGRYVANYDEHNPYICQVNYGNPKGLFAIAKGLDHWDYGVMDMLNTHHLMKRFSMNMHCLDHYIGSTTYEWQ